MNILLISRSFYPAIGGLETVGRQLAEAWTERGHRVRIATLAPLGDARELDGVEVLRRPRPLDLLEAARRCDVCVQSGISLRSLWAPLITHRPLVFIHHDLLNRQGGWPGLQDALKRQAARLGTNVAVSRAVARDLPRGTRVIPNAFRPRLRGPGTARDRDGLLFVGRLVSSKGCDLALRAVDVLRRQGEPVRLTICGDGPERPALERLADELGLRDAVTFTGWTDDAALAERYATTATVLVPSRYEPFGIVALEALAGGSVVVCSDADGLPEAVGSCGLFFPAGDADRLADRIREARRPAVRRRLLGGVEAHLRRFEIDDLADRYLQVLARAARRRLETDPMPEGRSAPARMLYR